MDTNSNQPTTSARAMSRNKDQPSESACAMDTNTDATSRSASVSTEVTCAYVMYRIDKQKEIVDISDVFEEDPTTLQRLEFHPKHINDFDEKKRYVIRTTTGNEKGDKKKHAYHGYIGKLGVSMESLRQELAKKRYVFGLNLGANDTQQPLSSSEESTVVVVGAQAMNAARNDTKKQDNLRRQRNANELRQLVAKAAPKPPNTCDVTAMQEEINRLKRQLEEKEKGETMARTTSQQQLESICNRIEEKFNQKLSDTIKEIGVTLKKNLIQSVQQEVSSSLKEEVAKAVEAKMDELIRKFTGNPPLKHVEEWLDKCPL